MDKLYRTIVRAGRICKKQEFKKTTGTGKPRRTRKEQPLPLVTGRYRYRYLSPKSDVTVTRK